MSPTTLLWCVIGGGEWVCFFDRRITCQRIKSHMSSAAQDEARQAQVSERPRPSFRRFPCGEWYTRAIEARPKGRAAITISNDSGFKVQSGRYPSRQRLIAVAARS